MWRNNCIFAARKNKKNKTMKQTLLLLAACALFFGCTKDYGNPTTQDYPINGDYTCLSVSHAFEVTVSDQVSSAQVTVGERAHDRVEVYVKNGTLHIGFKLGTIYTGTAKAVIPANANICELDLSGASTFTGNLNGGDVDIDLSGASVYSGNVTATDIDIDLSGASVATMRGSCQNTMEMGLSGASELFASNLTTQVVKGDMSGASKADVTCCTSLNVTLRGASELTYSTVSGSCNPTVNCPTSSGSSVTRH